MKFAQEFRKALQQEGFPQRWVDCAIPYGQLKKCLKRDINELKELGLGKAILAQLVAGQQLSANHPFDFLSFIYSIDKKAADSGHCRPRLTVSIHLQDGVVVDAKLTPSSRELLQEMALQHTGPNGASPPDHASVMPSTMFSSSQSAVGNASDIRQIEVPLVFEEFFEILQTDMSSIGTLQDEEQAKLESQIIALGKDLGRAVEPSRGRKAKADLEVWRKIFELYLDARVFFSTQETDHGARTSTMALERLQWFQDQVVQRKLVQKLKLGSSFTAFDNFVGINATLLSILKFKEINRLAVSKILKKFDKRTSLGVSTAFPIAVSSGRSLAGGMARDVCAIMSTELISVVPQLDDYLCPICLAIAYWPVRLQCQHVFCSRCLVKMSRRGERYCPLCRADTIMLAGLENFDADHAAFLRKYFPKEVKEKVRANERERNQEIFGPGHNNVFCSVM